MSIMRSLSSGVSGLRGMESKMDVIGNNIANVDTTGFKSGRVSFSEMMSQSTSRPNQSGQNAPQRMNQIGLGVQVASIDRNLNQGSIETTDRPTDLAIDGQGYFMVNDGETDFLSRAGNFEFNDDGKLVTQGGLSVQGYNANAEGDIITGGATEDLQINMDDTYDPQATSSMDIHGNLNNNTSLAQIITQAQAFTTNSGDIADDDTLLQDIDQFTDLADGDIVEVNLIDNDGNDLTAELEVEDDDTTLEDLRAAIADELNDPDEQASVSLEDGVFRIQADELGESELNVLGMEVDGTGSVSSPSFQTTQFGETNSQRVSSTVYDAVGEAHTMVMELTQNDHGDWEYEISFLDGEEIIDPDDATGELEFDQNGNLVSDPRHALSFDPGNGSSNVNFTINFEADGNSLTERDANTTAQVASQDGFAQGELVDAFIDADGYVVGDYSNGQSRQLGQLAIGEVANPQGLSQEGSNLLGLTNESGDVSLTTANNMADTGISAGALEGSNVDLAQEFTDMIVTQRAYQSNARVVQTADQILNEAVGLKR